MRWVPGAPFVCELATYALRVTDKATAVHAHKDLQADEQRVKFLHDRYPRSFDTAGCSTQLTAHRIVTDAAS
jgi:hypothetical protein